ncbi:MAG: membrane protein insertase YidC [Bacteroidales bacterium]
MNKNSVLGFVLIGAILIGFSWYNTKIIKEQEQIKLQKDSIELAQGLGQKIEPKDSQETVLESLPNRDSKSASIIEDRRNENIYKETFLSAASIAQDNRTTLENDKIKIEFSNLGAQPKNVEIKNNYTYDSLALMLIKEKGSNFALNFYAGQQLSTSNFGFDLYSSSDNSIVYRLYIDSLSYIEYNYSLSQESYMVDLDITMVGLNKHIPRNETFIDLEWFLDVPRQEKGYKNERNYSTIVYKFPNSTSVEDLGLRKDNASDKITTRVNWVAFQQQFFSAILVAKDDFNSGILSFRMYPEDNPDRNLMNCTANMQIPYNGDEVVNVPLQFYFGPNHFKTLKSYDMGFEKIVPLGGWIIGWVNRYVIIVVFDFLGKFINSYGLIIFLLTILIKLVISPLTIKSYLSSAKMRVLKPEVDKINAKYPKQDDAMKKQQEVMALYKKTGVSMFGGCLPMLLQFPILFAMFRFFPASFELRQESFLWAEDLSAFDSILNLPFTIPLYGDHVSLFALLMAFSMFFYSRMNMDQMNAGPQMAGMKYMSLYFMPLFLLVLGNNFSSGLSYYYLLSNLFTMGQTWIIRKYFVDEEKILSKLKEKAAVPKKKSKFQERLDAAYKAQQQQKNKR